MLAVTGHKEVPATVIRQVPARFRRKILIRVAGAGSCSDCDQNSEDDPLHGAPFRSRDDIRKGPAEEPYALGAPDAAKPGTIGGTIRL
jgi:hypothetical protein